MNKIVEFSDAELQLVQEIVDRRYGVSTEIQPVTTEIRLYQEDQELTQCSGLYWEGRKANFLIFKTNIDRFRSLFFYRVRSQYGTGIPEYDDLKECVTHLLQVQADHEAKGGDTHVD
ncbi:conserved hypothetical protein [Gammaproteobacteria bacterium]